MRKLHLLFTLALLCLGVYQASAKLVLGEQKTTFAPGDKLVFQTCQEYTGKEAWEAKSWLCTRDIANNSVELAQTLSPELPETQKGIIFEIMDAQNPMTYNGKTYTGFNLYSPDLSKYAAYEASVGKYYFKRNPARAETFYLIPLLEYVPMCGADREFYDNAAESLKKDLDKAFVMAFRTKADGEGTGGDGYNYRSLSHSNAGPGNIWTGAGVGWPRSFYAFEASDEEDPTEGLKLLLQDLENVVNNAQTGTMPGYVADAEAFEALKKAYTDAQAADVDVEKAYKELTEAYDKFKAAGEDGFIPLTEGYWYIVSNYAQFEEKQGVKKAIYATGNTLGWKTLDEEDLSQVWQVQRTDDPNKFVLRNMSTLYYIHKPNVYGETSTDSLTCTVQRSVYGYPRFTVGNGASLYAGSHNNGDGISGGISTYSGDGNSPTTGAGVWRLFPAENIDIDQVLAQAEQTLRNRKYEELLATAHEKYNIALSFLPNSYPEDGILKYVVPEVQSRVTTQEARLEGGRIFCNSSRDAKIPLMCNGIWDDQTESFQTDWKESSHLPLHHFQFDLDEEIEYASFFVAAVANNYMHSGPSVVDVQVCKDTLSDNSGKWTTVQTLYMNYLLPGDQGVINGKEVVGGEVMYSDPVSLGGNYKHIRFVIREAITGKYDAGNGQYTYTKATTVAPFIRINEINIMKAQLDPNCQMFALKNDATIAPIIAALENEFAKSATIQAPSAKELDELQKVYDDFIAVFPDPTPLKALIADTQEYMQNMYVGGVPGTYATQAELDEKLLAVQKVIEDAQADIDEQTLFSKNQVNAHIDAINAARQALIDGARPIDFTKWVRLYLTREYWVKNPDKKPENWPDNVAMYAPEEAESETTQVPFGLFNGDMATAFDWRFVPVKDGYFIQSRATGKFIGSGRIYESSRDWDPALSSVPAVFTVEPIGGGSFLIIGKGMNGGEVTNYDGYKYLHGAFAPEKVTYWNHSHLGSNSGWEFEIQSDNAFDDDAADEMQNNALVTKHLVPNRLYTACYPTDVTIAPETEGMAVAAYKVAGKNADESVIYLEKIEGEEGMISIPAGTPFLYEIGEEGTNFTDYMYSAEEETNAEMQVYYDFYPTLDAEENESLYVRAPQKADGITGTFTDQKIYQGHGLVSVYEGSNAVYPYGFDFVEEDDETIETVLYRTEASIDTKSAAVLGDNEVADYLALPIAGKIDNAIEGVTDGNDNAATVDVYTIDGVRVRANVAKANALKGLKPGLYIVNKTKIMVK